MKRSREEFEEEEKEFKEEDKEKSIYSDGGGWWRGKFIGSGGHGMVYLAHFPKHSKFSSRFDGFPEKVAVKSAYIASDSGELQREKAVYEKLAEKKSPFLLRYLGNDVTVAKDGRHLLNLFLEYASGGTLHDVIANSRERGLLEWQVKGFARSILLGISQIHEEGYVHRDLKPGNVLLVEHGNGFLAKIGDFGLVKSVDGEADVVVGTGNYFAPESTMDGVQEQASDIWAFGCIVYAMFYGKTDLVGVMIIDNSGKKYSRVAADFMHNCFRESDSERPSAEMLLSHPFIATLGAGEGGAGKECRKPEKDEESTDVGDSMETEMSEKEGESHDKPRNVLGGDEDENMSSADSSEMIFRGEEDGYDGDQGSDSSQNMG